MKTRTSLNVIWAIILVALLGKLTAFGQVAEQKNDWSKFENYPIPEWYLDAKLGIYTHWGVYSVPEFMTEWYPHWMYYSEKEHSRGLKEYHEEVYGPISEFGYKELIPLFTAENFDPEEWAELFIESGAKFAGPVAEHHDGFSMWDSEINRWNSVDMGPKRDVVGELLQTYKKNGLKTIATFHTPRNIYGYYPDVEGADVNDKKYYDLYGKYDDMNLAHEVWFKKTKEVIDKYQPDQILFDGKLYEIPEDYRLKLASYYYAKAKEWNKEVIFAYKNKNMPEGTALLDVEKGKMSTLQKRAWQTDDCFNTHSWDYMAGNFFKPREEIIHDLIDVVSKNGIVLLNVGPKSDGSIDKKTQKYLRMLGSWLKVNGESIYGTRPWLIHGEGPSLYNEGRGFGDKERDAVKFTNQDFRFTRKGDDIYVIAMGWPEDEFTLESMKFNNKENINGTVQLVGSTVKVAHKISKDGYLTISTPELQPNERPCGYAFSFKLSGFDIKKSEFSSPEVITLTAKDAELSGIQIRVKTVNYLDVINNWGKPSSYIKWIVKIPKAGTYSIRGKFAGVSTGTSLKLEVNNKEKTFDIPKTNYWYCGLNVDVTRVTFKEAGEYELFLKSPDPSSWKQVNVWNIQLVPSFK